MVEELDGFHWLTCLLACIRRGKHRFFFSKSQLPGEAFVFTPGTPFSRDPMDFSTRTLMGTREVVGASTPPGAFDLWDPFRAYFAHCLKCLGCGLSRKFQLLKWVVFPTCGSRESISLLDIYVLIFSQGASANGSGSQRKERSSGSQLKLFQTTSRTV